MKVQEFVELYKEGKIELSKDVLEVKDYIPFSQKYELCSSVLDTCNDIDVKTGLVSVDSVNRNVTFIVKMISMYTNIEFSPDGNLDVSSIDEYDMLCENKLLKPIIGLFAEEYVECEEMLMTMQNDLITNNNTLHNVLGNGMKYFLGIADVLKKKIDTLNLDLNQDNIDNYAKLFEALKK